jgi:hypothetical protein
MSQTYIPAEMRRLVIGAAADRKRRRCELIRPRSRPHPLGRFEAAGRVREGAALVVAVGLADVAAPPVFAATGGTAVFCMTRRARVAWPGCRIRVW